MRPLSARSLMLVGASFAGGLAVGALAARTPQLEHASAAGVASEKAANYPPGQSAFGGAARKAVPTVDVALDAAGETDLASALHEAAGQRDYGRRRFETYQVALQLDEEGLADALAITGAMPVGPRTWIQSTLVSRWLELNPAAAVAWVRASTPSKARTELLGETFQMLGLKDPQAALRFLAETGRERGEGDDDFVRKLFDGWGHHDPAAAANAALTLPREARGTALHASLYQWARVEPAAALAWLDEATEPAVRANNRDTILRIWADTDPEAAATYAFTLQGKPREEALGLVIRGLAVTDAAAAERLLEQIPAGRARHEQTRSVISDIDDDNPELAARLMLSLPAKDQNQSLYGVARAFARSDRAAALEWAAQLARPNTREQALSYIVDQWAADEPQAAAEYCTRNLTQSEDALRGVIGTWTSAEPKAALAWVRAVPASAQRDALLSTAAAAIGQDDHEAGLRIAETLPLGSDAQRDAISNIAAKWARNDPGAALAWASQSVGPAAKSALFHVLPTTSREDPAATAVWLDKLPAGERRDGAIVTFAMHVAADDPETAAAWAATISDAQQRANSLENVFTQWRHYDKEAALQWLRQSPHVTNEVRQRYVRQFQEEEGER